MGTTTGTELWGLGASELAAAIRERRVSSREAVLAHLARVEAVNPRVNAVTRVLGDEALAAADAADRRLADGDEVGPLHGVPFTVKENVDLAGSATTQGVAALVSAVPDVDAPHVGHLRAAGAIPIGRTNLPDFGLRWHTDNAVHGATHNPWDASLTPGGSSGGEAAALATGMTPLGVGNDLGGSLRWPAQCTGIVSIKPTLGRVPSATVIEPLDPPISIQLMAVQGPMARHVVDLRLALEVMSRPSARDPWHVPAPLTGVPLPAPVRVAIVSAPAGGDTSPQVAEGVGRAADALRAAGYEVEETEPPDVPAVAATWTSILAFDVRFLWQLMSPLASEDANRFMGIFMEMNPPVEPDAYVQALMARNALCRAWAEFQQTYPLIVAPISTQPPFPVGADLDADRVGAIANSMRMLVAANLLGVPAAAVPTGVGQGLPQVVEVIGPRFREDLCLAAAEAIQDACGIPTPIDPR